MLAILRPHFCAMPHVLLVAYKNCILHVRRIFFVSCAARHESQTVERSTACFPELRRRMHHTKGRH